MTRCQLKIGQQVHDHSDGEVLWFARWRRNRGGSRSAVCIRACGTGMRRMKYVDEKNLSTRPKQYYPKPQPIRCRP